MAAEKGAVETGPVTKVVAVGAAETVVKEAARVEAAMAVVATVVGGTAALETVAVAREAVMKAAAVTRAVVMATKATLEASFGVLAAAARLVVARESTGVAEAAARGDVGMMYRYRS